MAAQICEHGDIVAERSRAPATAGHGLSVRDRQIVADFFGSYSEKNVAERNGCGERTVRRVWERAKAAGLLPEERKQRTQYWGGERLAPCASDVDPKASRDLWRYVILQAAADAVGDEPPERKKARRWFLRPNRDFDLVCEFAGYEPHTIRSRFEDAIKKIDGEAGL